MTVWDGLRPYLPSDWLAALAVLPAAVGEEIQEIRLRNDTPVTVSLPGGQRYLTRHGLSAAAQSGVFYCSRRQVEECFLSFCGRSVYAHQWELGQGYVAVPGGIRVGVAGTAVLRDGAVYAVQQVTALCVRLPRRVAGCARPLAARLLEGDTPANTLLVGPPACGKTTLLRDLAAQLAARHHRVAVVDERGELSLDDALRGCDVLRGYPKAVGVRQAVRCLAPDFILLDELGDGAEVQAVADCAHAGVAVVATLHGYTPSQMEHQPFVQDLLRRRVFLRWMFLQGRATPGQIGGDYIPEVTPDGVDWRPAAGGGGNGIGDVCRRSPATAGGVFGGLRADVAGVVAGDELHRPADARFVATAGCV